MFRKLILFVLLAAMTQLAWAQLSTGGEPYSFSHNLPKKSPIYSTPEIDVQALVAEDEIDLQSNLPLRFAFGHEVEFDLNNSGRWTELKGGDRVWQFTIHCPDALNVNLLYSDFFMPRGASLYLFNADGSQVLGAFTEQNNKDNRRFATALVHGEFVTLEYYEPAAVRGQGSIRIAQVGHGYRDLDGNSSQAKVSGDCQVNVNCDEGNKWQDEKKGVAKIIMDGLYLCSGTLVNNTANDCKPLFLTANHCLMGGIVQDAIINPDVSGYVFYWNYEYPDCANAGPLPEQTTNGGTVLANAGIQQTGTHTILSSDFALIELDENPRGAYDVYFAGWDASGVSGEGGVGIHHPAGDAKKISTHSTTPLAEGYYWELYWDATQNGHSVTEGGSSGSALFRETGLIIGQLFGGGSVNCDDPANDLGMYGMLSYSWTNDDDLLIALTNDARRRLNTWLDPIGGGSIRVLEGTYDPCETPMVYLKSTSASISEENPSVIDGCRGYTDYTYDLGITPYPTQPVVATLFAEGTAAAGPADDYELLTPSITFNNVTNSGSFTLRVYDDAYPEATEDVLIGFNPAGTNGLTVGTLTANATQLIQITSDDAIPNTHVQTVRNDDSPAEEYLGPYGTVYFQDPGSDGMMIAIENLSDHDFGCVQVSIDHPGSTANNAWSSGTTLSKTYLVEADHPAEDAPVRMNFYVDDGEIFGWEWFNNEGLSMEDLQLLTFDGPADLANESACTGSLLVAEGPYRSHDYIFTADATGLPYTENGFVLGHFGAPGAALMSNFQGGNLREMSLQPNLTRDLSRLRWFAQESGQTQVRVVNAQGQLVFDRVLTAETGYNELELDLSTWTPGAYWVQLYNEREGLQAAQIIRQ